MTYEEILIGKLKTNRTFLDLVERWAGYDFSKQPDEQAGVLLDALVNYQEVFGIGQNYLSMDFVIDYINYKLFVKICCSIFFDKFNKDTGSVSCNIKRVGTDGVHEYSLANLGTDLEHSMMNSNMIIFRFIENFSEATKFGFRAFYEEPVPATFKNCDLLDHVVKFRGSLDQGRDVEVKLRDFNKNMFQELLEGKRK